MEKKYFVMYLRPNRPDFAQTMTPEELAIMQQHVAYWKPYLDSGTLIVYGPVFDPNGAYGIGIVGVQDEKELQALIEKDPASKINRYEYFPMRAVVK
jgi:uncharacterized protein YciI